MSIELTMGKSKPSQIPSEEWALLEKLQMGFNFLQKASFSHEVLAGRCWCHLPGQWPSARTGGLPGGSGSLGGHPCRGDGTSKNKHGSPHCQDEAPRIMNPIHCSAPWKGPLSAPLRSPVPLPAGAVLVSASLSTGWDGDGGRAIWDGLGGGNGIEVGAERQVYTWHPCHIQVQARLWLNGSLMGFWRFIRDLELLEYLGWPHEHPAVLTKELRVLLSWHRGASLIEKAVIRNKIVERSHWHSLPRAEIMNGLLTCTPLARKCQDA